MVVVGGGMAGLSCAVALKVKCYLGPSSAGITRKLKNFGIQETNFIYKNFSK